MVSGLEGLTAFSLTYFGRHYIELSEEEEEELTGFMDWCFKTYWGQTVNLEKCLEEYWMGGYHLSVQSTRKEK